MANKPVGWRKDSARHALAAKGVKTGRSGPRSALLSPIKVQAIVGEKNWYIFGMDQADEQLRGTVEQFLFDYMNDQITDSVDDEGRRIKDPSMQDFVTFAEMELDERLNKEFSDEEDYLQLLSPIDQLHAKQAWIQGYAQYAHDRWMMGTKIHTDVGDARLQPRDERPPHIQSLAARQIAQRKRQEGSNYWGPNR